MASVSNRLAAVGGASQSLTRGLEWLAPLGDLAIRLYVANVFWKAGLTKIASWETTVLLFTYEYQVPLLAPAFAAALATFIELVCPVLLALGLAGRFSAFVLLAFNVMAVVSYPSLSDAGREWHYAWGLLLLVPLLHGPGRISGDYLLKRWWAGRTGAGSGLRAGNV